MIKFNFILESPFHIYFFDLLHRFFFISHMFRDIYRIYGLIIVKIVKKSLILDYGLSNATFETPNRAFN
jgi:hypothetical protein